MDYPDDIKRNEKAVCSDKISEKSKLIREDGSTRPKYKVKPGYIPPDQVQKYVIPQRRFDNHNVSNSDDSAPKPRKSGPKLAFIENYLSSNKSYGSAKNLTSPRTRQTKQVEKISTDSINDLAKDLGNLNFNSSLEVGTKDKRVASINKAGSNYKKNTEIKTTKFKNKLVKDSSTGDTIKSKTFDIKNSKETKFASEKKS